ncbi:hypothetical protein ABT237_05965 [Streptomyces sp. NPDC001581]|uniref:hypothetical protein n=1 Tax=Streptomyces sp. NPDC001581 TaxID=3154386 RepID=UPI00332CF965
MSSRTDNRHRVATICREATGLAHHTCMRWAADGLITRRRPVPDAADEQQWTFEALVVAELANGLRGHEQRDGALLGFTHARPEPAGLTLSLHPAMADRVLGTLLPRIDQHQRGLRGVPGLRLVPMGGKWVLTRVQGRAAIHLVHPDADWRPALPQHGEGLTQLWRRNRHRMHPAEAADWEQRSGAGHGHDGVPAQNRLNSRLLRRPRLLGAAGAAHGSAHVYTHGGGDVVVEWCCSVERSDLERRLRRSGLAERPDGGPARERERDRPWFPGEIAMGGGFVTLRRGPCHAATAEAGVR